MYSSNFGACHISDCRQSNKPFSVNRQNENNHKPQNVFRIKAKQSGAMMILSSCVFAFSKQYYSRPFYYNYNAATFSRHFSQHQLRAPPGAC